jgi:hypothetical protein
MVLKFDSAFMPAHPPGIEIPGYQIASHPGQSPGQGRPWLARDFNPGRARSRRQLALALLIVGCHS